MKRVFRISLRVVTVLGVLTAATALLCLDGVDYRPYFRQPYYSNTAALLRASAETNTLARGELAAGFGCAVLTPKVNAAQDLAAEGQFRTLPLAGYGGRRGKPATGMHDDLHVKAVALKVQNRLGVMVGADALIIPAEVAEKAVRRLEEEAGLTRAQIYFGATHTHSSLGAWGEGKVAESFAGGFQPEARTWFADRIVTAVRDAIKDLKPAQFGHGSVAASAFIRNRLVGGLGEVDPEFSYAVVKQDTGKLAVLGVYGAHATVLGSGNKADAILTSSSCADATFVITLTATDNVGGWGVAYLTGLRGADNARARLRLDWRPRYLSWRDGFAAELTGTVSTSG